jgi:hypothetical protein
MTLPTPVRPLLLVAAVALGLSACSDEQPPTWLQDLATEAQTTSTTVPSSTAVPSTTSPPDQDDATAALDLVKGTCVVDAPFTEGQPVEVISLPTVDCEKPHRAEVYDVVRLPQPRGEPFPGDALVARARQVCLDRFEAFVGLPWTASELDFVALRPTEESWAEGDRAIACVLFRPDGKDLEGTALGAGY